MHPYRSVPSRLLFPLLLCACALSLSACGKASSLDPIPLSVPAVLESGAGCSSGTGRSLDAGKGEILSSEEALSIEEKETLTVSEPAASAPMRRVAYFTSWSAYARGLEVKDLDPALLTHINFAFANLNQNGEICVGDSWADTEKPFSGDTWEESGKVKGHFGQLQRLKKANPNLQILISVGGWTWSGNFSSTAATEAGRKTFADSAVKFLTQYEFDGLDIDWEFPVEGGNGIEHRPEDRENYTLLLREVRAALDRLGEQEGRHYLLTIAGGPNPSFPVNTQLEEMMEYVDFINVMTYDYHGSWDAVTGHNAPLYASDGLSVSDTINAYLAAGALPHKLNLGLAFYGRGWAGASDSAPGHAAVPPAGTGYGLGTWESSVFDYWDLENHYVGKNGYVRYFDSTARVPYLYNGSTFISYDDPESIREKLSFAAQKNLGGIMFWEFGGDKEKKLQRLIFDFSQQGGEGAEAQTVQPAKAQSAESGQEKGHNAPGWESGAIYQGGELVSYSGELYQAKWWTQNQEPSSNCQEWGPWKKAE